MPASTANQVRAALKKTGNPNKAKIYSRFFKTGKGEYGEGDLFYGITVPEQRKIAREFFADLPLAEIRKLLAGKYHEERFTALEMLVMKFEAAAKSKNTKAQKEIYEFYLKNTKFINNWDLVDTSAEYIVGAYLLDKPRKILYTLAKSKDLWEKRIAMISCFKFIKNNQFDDALKIATILMKDDHDLIHKAVGWMLREIGNRNLAVERQFLDKHVLNMPRTMLRYAIERFPEKLRLKYLKIK